MLLYRFHIYTLPNPNLRFNHGSRAGDSLLVTTGQPLSMTIPSRMTSDSRTRYSAQAALAFSLPRNSHNAAGCLQLSRKTLNVLRRFATRILTRTLGT